MDTINVVLTAVIAATTVVYTIVTARLLSATRQSADLTRQALLLTFVMHEAELTFREGEQNPDGSLRFGAEMAPMRNALRRYKARVCELREKVEALG